ncbi:histidine kinase dimerization/phospho-acceptor domain-containing protein [Mesorhizobium sp. A556]
MPPDSYSFLDVAVLDPVRQRFASGDAVVILSVDLEQVIWANGPGAALLGYPDIEATIGASARLPLIARRQVMATGGFPEIGSDRALLVRLATGVTSHAVPLLASAVTMPDGEKAIMLAAPPAQAEPPDTAESARRAIAGFSEGGHFLAFVDGEGKVEASSAGFATLGIAQQTLVALVADVAGGRDRIVKRLVPGEAGAYPAGFARLTEDPVRHLLVVIDEARLEGATSSHPEAEQEAEALVAPGSQEPQEHEADTRQMARESATSLHDHWYFNTENEGEAAQQPSHPTPYSIAEAERAAAEKAEEKQDLPAPAIKRNAPPVRFVWRTDADGMFSMVSPEFVAVVGAPATDIIGRRFKDVATVFGFDPAGEIADLLERRDTWSGRSVLWPVAGTDLAVPVDLAALPVYDRNRVFEGFRGFGVARVADAVADPEAVGLALVKTTPEPKEPAMEGSEPAAPKESADPFKGEVPALTIVPKQERRFADKVIRLAEHRQPANDKGLSSLERSAFREIGERLRKDSTPGSREDQPRAPESPPAKAEPADAGPVASVPEASDAAPPEADLPVGSEASETPDEPDRQVGGKARETTSGSVLDYAENGNESTDDLASEPELKAEDSPSAFSTGRAGAGTPDTSILGKLPVPLLFHSGDSLHYANDEFLHLTGYETLADLEQAGGLGALFADPYAQQDAPDSADRTLKLKTQDGLEFPIDAILRSVPWGDGKALMLVVRRSGDDGPQEPAAPPIVEAPAQTQPDLADLKARIAEMRTVIDTATDGVVLIDRDGTIRSISRPAEALFGFDSDDVAGKPFASLFAIESQRAARDYLNGLSDNGVASVLNDGREVIGREAQGRFIPMFMTIGRLPNESGFCAVVRDITQWKRAEEDLTQARAVAERASSQKTDFLARISHEIRTPLNAIIGFSELMVDEKFGPVANDRYRDYLRDINRSGNHVLDLVNDLLDISKIEAGQQEMDYEAVSLNETLAETVAMMQPQANRERVIIRSSFASKLPEVVADLRSVRQIALNILSNAIRYTQAGGQVILSTAYEPSGDVVMRVRDTGIGMSQAEIEQALKPFKQINALKRGRNDGTGLGLPLTKAMVEANRARFSINSTPGEGTLVEVAFPSTRVLAE